MLVLSRQRDESVLIGAPNGEFVIPFGQPLIITVVDIRGDKVRLGFTIPSNIPCHREEVYRAIQRENERDIKSRR